MDVHPPLNKMSEKNIYIIGFFILLAFLLITYGLLSNYVDLGVFGFTFSKMGMFWWAWIIVIFLIVIILVSLRKNLK